MNFLYAAYIATWIILGTYLAILVRKYSRIRREMESLKRKVTSG